MSDTTVTNPAIFDTHRFITHRGDAGFTPAQAEALSEEQVNMPPMTPGIKREYLVATT